MSYKRFDSQDVVVSSDSITAPAWSNNGVRLQSASMALDSTQIASTSGKYYYDVSSGSAVQFAVAYGNRLGSGSGLYDASITGKSYSSTVYGQFRTLLLGDEETDFTFDNNGTTVTPDNVYFVSIERARFKESIFPASLDLILSGSGGGINLTDNSADVTSETFADAGRVYSVYQGRTGSVDSTTVEYGKIYTDVGVIALNGDILSSSNFVSGAGYTVSNYTTTNNNAAIWRSMVSGSRFGLRSKETISSNYVFVRARNDEFNYSNNPSNITGSGELRHSVMIDSPQSYITAVGLYNDNNDLLAVAKLSTPLLKDFTKEALVRVKLDY